MPAHTVGVWVTGALREADGKFLYDFYAGNGQQIQGGTLDMQTGGTCMARPSREHGCPFSSTAAPPTV